MGIRQCPYCGRYAVARSRRTGWFEAVVLPPILLRPFRCLKCHRRHYGFVFAQMASSKAKLPRTVPTGSNWITQHAHLLIPFLCVPLVLAGTRVRPWVQPVPSSGPSQAPSRSSELGLGAVKALVPTSLGPQRAISKPSGISDTEGAVELKEAYGLKKPTLASPNAQQETRRPLGALSASGEVYVNNSPAPSQSTIFAGDTVRTGDGGAASFSLSGQGSLSILSRTEVSFVDQPQYIADLNYGTVAIHFLAEGKNLALKVSDFAVLAEPSIESNAEIDRTVDGSARISCQTGSVGIVALAVTGPQALFLKPGQSATISPAGELRAAPPGPAAPSPMPSTTKKKSKAVWIVLGLAGGGAAAGAAVALASGGGRRAVSPSVP